MLKRVEEEHPSGMAEPAVAKPAVPIAAQAAESPARKSVPLSGARKIRVQAALLELLVAGAIGLGFAAAGSRLLWPVMVIALYHAAGMLLTGTSPMMALLGHVPSIAALAVEQPGETDPAGESRVPATARRPESDARQRRAQRARRAQGRADQSAARR